MMPQPNSSTNSNTLSAALGSLPRVFARQVKFPGFNRAVTESFLFGCVFLSAGYISLGLGIKEMLVPMVPVVLCMMLSMAFSGVYRPEINHSIMNLYVHSIYGFVLGSVLVVVGMHFFAPQYATVKFEFFFLFFSFFVINTLRPITSGTDFMDGGGRRTN